MTTNNSMGRFFEWLVKPMSEEDLIAWNLANNIIPELTDLFRDFCFSLIQLLKDTYLGDELSSNKETKVGMTVEQKKQHFKWCWNKTVENFQKEEILFKFTESDIEFFESFFLNIYYEQPDNKIKETMDVFFSQIFDKKSKKTKSDVEIFTDIYKMFERSLKNH